METFIDTNILISIFDDKCSVHKWARETLIERKSVGPVIICDVVYSEFSVGMKNKAETDAALAELSIERLHFTNDVLFRAGRAFKKYKNDNSGPKMNVLPDFLIGAQAAVEQIPLLTMNKSDFITYFPELIMITP